MKNTLKLGMFATTALMLISCGNDKKTETENTDEIVLEERTLDDKEMKGMETKKETQSIAEKSSVSTEMKIDKAPLAFRETSSQAVWDAYTNVKLALIASDAAKAKTAAANLAMIFDESNAGLKSKAESIATTEDLKEQRKAFSQFSVAAEKYFKNKVAAGTLYKQHCPMAFDGKGADWLSNEEAIQNPYYGDKMLNCGSVIATITK